MELAALALPAHPAALGRVPASLPVEEQEAGAAAGASPWRSFSRSIAALPRWRGARRRRRVLGRRVEPVRQQGEPEVAVAVRQVVDLEAADLGLDVRLAREERRHDDERAQLATARPSSRSSRGSGRGPERAR